MANTTQPKQKKQTDRKQLTKKNCKIKEDIENFFYGRKREADRRDMRQLMAERSHGNLQENPEAKFEATITNRITRPSESQAFKR